MYCPYSDKLEGRVKAFLICVVQERFVVVALNFDLWE